MGVRFSRIVRKALFWGLAVMAASALLLYGLIFCSYKLTRYEVRQKMASGEAVFKHEDQATTQILNYLAGKEDLPREARIDLARKVIAFLWRASGLEPTRDLSEMDEAGLERPRFSFRSCQLLIPPGAGGDLPGGLIIPSLPY